MQVPEPQLLSLDEAAAHVGNRCAIGIDEAESALRRAFREASLSLYSDFKQVELRQKDEIDFRTSTIRNLAVGYVISVQVYKQHIDKWLAAAELQSPRADWPVPDWSFWLNVSDVPLIEAVALWLGIDPKSLSKGQSSRGLHVQGLPAGMEAEFAKRHELAMRNLGSALAIMNRTEHRHGADPKIRLRQFAAWVVRIGWPVPSELAALAEPEAAAPAKMAPVVYQRQMPRSAARDWLGTTYPKGIQAGKTDKELVREYQAFHNGARMSPRTMRRARTGE